jgi:hypothetical protein
VCVRIARGNNNEEARHTEEEEERGELTGRMRGLMTARPTSELGVLHLFVSFVFLLVADGVFSHSDQLFAKAHSVSLFCGHLVHELPLFHGPHPHSGEGLRSLAVQTLL